MARTSRAITVLSMVGLVALTGCGNSSTSSAPSISQPPRSNTSTTVAPTTTVAPFTVDKAWSFTVTKPDRSSVQVTLETGPPVKVGSEPPVPRRPHETVAHPCTPNPQRDAIIPYRLIRTSLTQSFDVTVPVNFYWAPAGGLHSSPVEAESWYSSGSDCTRLGDITTSGSWGVGGELAPGATKTLYGYFVITDYYTPLHPEGDATRLAEANLRYWGETGVPIDMANLEGPGITRYMGGPLIPLSGSAPLMR